MVGPARPLSHALHADLVILDEFGGALLPRPHRVHYREELCLDPRNWPMRSSRSWPRATTILGATFGKPRAKTSCARSMRPDRRSPRSSQQVRLFQRRHTSIARSPMRSVFINYCTGASVSHIAAPLMPFVNSRFLIIIAIQPSHAFTE